MASFNFIAPYYDFLSGLVYGNKLNLAKKKFINLIPPGAKVLMMGGGTGPVLNDVLILNPTIQMDFIEPSSKMIAIAQQRLNKRFVNNVRFICGDHHAIPAGVSYDVATSFFVLDCLRQPDGIDFAKAVTAQLKPEGLWLFADFYTDKSFLHSWLIWIMYRFFKVVSGISAGRLPDYEAIFKTVNFQPVAEQQFLGGLIRSKVYKAL